MMAVTAAAGRRRFIWLVDGSKGRSSVATCGSSVRKRVDPDATVDWP